MRKPTLRSSALQFWKDREGVIPSTLVLSLSTSVKDEWWAHYDDLSLFYEKAVDNRCLYRTTFSYPLKKPCTLVPLVIPFSSFDKTFFTCLWRTPEKKIFWQSGARGRVRAGGRGKPGAYELWMGGTWPRNEKKAERGYLSQCIPPMCMCVDCWSTYWYNNRVRESKVDNEQGTTGTSFLIRRTNCNLVWSDT